MRSFPFLTLLNLIICVKGSVIFPYQQNLCTTGQTRRFGRDLKKPERTNQRRLRRALSPISSSVGSGQYGMIRNFSGLLGAAALIKIGNIVTSESFRRALYFWIHAGPIVVHYKFTRWYLTKTKAPIEKRDEVYNTLHDRYCDKSFGIILHLQGLYVKIAQIISSRPDFVPPQYIDLFITAQDSIPQWPIEDVITIVKRSLDSEFGLEFDEVFESIDPITLGSASIGQVHRAKLRKQFFDMGGYTGGADVAVKVMHPNAESKFHHVSFLFFVAEFASFLLLSLLKISLKKK